MFKTFLCDLLGHKLRYNFATLPSKCICKRCGMKWEKPRPTGTWLIVEQFPPHLGNTEEIKKRWHKNLNY